MKRRMFERLNLPKRRSIGPWTLLAEGLLAALGWGVLIWSTIFLFAILGPATK